MIATTALNTNLTLLVSVAQVMWVKMDLSLEGGRYCSPGCEKGGAGLL